MDFSAVRLEELDDGRSRMSRRRQKDNAAHPEDCSHMLASLSLVLYCQSKDLRCRLERHCPPKR
jgi:hypothetical protein